MVLICPDLVKRLNLPLHPLETPECVNVAMGSSNQISQLTHYVVTDPASLDNCFCSHLLHAIIAPGLNVTFRTFPLCLLTHYHWDCHHSLVSNPLPCKLLDCIM